MVKGFLLENSNHRDQYPCCGFSHGDEVEVVTSPCCNNPACTETAQCVQGTGRNFYDPPVLKEADALGFTHEMFCYWDPVLRRVLRVGRDDFVEFNENCVPSAVRPQGVKAMLFQGAL